jgi:hypothetical protein
MKEDLDKKLDIILELLYNSVNKLINPDFTYKTLDLIPKTAIEMQLLLLSEYPISYIDIVYDNNKPVGFLLGSTHTAQGFPDSPFRELIFTKLLGKDYKPYTEYNPFTKNDDSDIDPTFVAKYMIKQKGLVPEFAQIHHFFVLDKESNKNAAEALLNKFESHHQSYIILYTTKSYFALPVFTKYHIAVKLPSKSDPNDFSLVYSYIVHPGIMQQLSKIAYYSPFPLTNIDRGVPLIDPSSIVDPPKPEEPSPMLLKTYN